jgi:hypothetical protein
MKLACWCSEPSLGTLDHSAAIDDEGALLDLIQRKVRGLLAVVAATKELVLKFDQVRPLIRAVLDAHEIKGNYIHEYSAAENKGELKQ